MTKIDNTKPGKEPETHVAKLRNALTPIYGLASNMFLMLGNKECESLLREQAELIETNRPVIDGLLNRLDLLSPSSTAPQPIDSIVDEYYEVYCPSKGITGIYTDDFVAFLSEGFTIQKKQP